MTGVIHVRPHRALGDVVEQIMVCDLPDPNNAGGMVVKVLPTTAPLIVVHYRAPVRVVSSAAPFSYRRVVTGLHAGTLSFTPTGSFGSVTARLKPEAVSRLIGYESGAFAEGTVDLADVFPLADIDRLTEQLAEADGSISRAALFETFLIAKLKDRRCDPRIERATALIGRDTSRAVHGMARDLGLSERQFSRLFRATIGVGPKTFAEITRLQGILSARWRGERWADIAAGLGYFDQPHMSGAFRRATGDTPEAFFAAARRKFSALNTAMGMSTFSNTYCF